MIGALSEWLRHLVVVILLAVFLDLALPSNAMQKYVRTVLGLVVMLTMLDPLRVLVATHFNLEAAAARLSGPVFQSAQFIGGGAASGAGTRGAFQTDLAATLRQEILQLQGVNVQNVLVTTSQGTDGAPLVTAVTVVIGAVKPATAAAVQAQVAESLGLAPGAVRVIYAGGQT
ncbi:MAG: stage III sporulation protein AF [Bacilli bacterium]